MIVTNMMGVAFSAALLAASDAGVTFVFPEDGATNTLAWTQLASASREAVCRAARFSPIPPGLAATWRLAEKNLRQLEAFVADERMAPREAVRRRSAIRDAFVKRCREYGVSEERIGLLCRRLFDSSNRARGYE